MTLSSKSLMFVFPILSFQISSLMEFEAALGIGVTFEGSIVNCFDQPKGCHGGTVKGVTEGQNIINITHQRKKGIHLFMKNALEIVQSESES